MNNTSTVVRAAVVTLAAAVLLAGCEKVALQADTVAAPAPAFSINELMVMIVDRPGELLWHVEKDGHAPRTAEDWYQLENHAVEVATAGQLIQLGGTGPADMGWAKQPAWIASSQDLVAAGLHARAAARNRDMAALVRANGEIVDACEACHKVFKPDIPTGGLFLHQGPEASEPTPAPATKG